MNKIEYDILEYIYENKKRTQREIAKDNECSLGVVNKSLKSLEFNGFIDLNMHLIEKGLDVIQKSKVKNAIILAAGYGMRMVPINTEIPKGLIEVYGEPLIERTIKQLHEVGVFDIYIVVGFLKEQYEYLIDEYGVNLIVNTDYATKNNIYSLKIVDQLIGNSFIIPCDVWCKENPYHPYELYSWYMVSEIVSKNSTVKVNRNGQLISVNESGNKMIGISYISEEDSYFLKQSLEEMCADDKYFNSFWEDALFLNKHRVYACVVDSNNVIEINTYEQLRDLDSNSNHLQTNAIDVICEALHVETGDITDISVLKKGMTNRSFMFRCNNEKYIMRIPGEGTDYLINRKQEAEVYSQISDKNICDDIVYINPDNGYKITKFIENARTCDAFCEEDLKKCMLRLRMFHELKLQVNHFFDIFGQIEFYESLWNEKASVYRDYEKTKENVFSLKEYIDQQEKNYCLTHIDAVPDNFLFSSADGNEKIYLIDWEYAGMQDPHVDIAMFCIYAMYDREHVDKLIDIYFSNNCKKETRIKIYCYIAACGLLWSNWCEYKRNLGIEFGEYSIRQYRYAKEYYRIVKQELSGGNYE